MPDENVDTNSAPMVKSENADKNQSEQGLNETKADDNKASNQNIAGPDVKTGTESQPYYVGPSGVVHSNKEDALDDKDATSESIKRS